MTLSRLLVTTPRRSVLALLTHTAPRSDQLRRGEALRTAIGPRDTSSPALCRARARPHDVLLAPGPFLPDLRRRFPLFVRWFTGTMAWSDSSATYMSAVRLSAFSDRSRSDREVTEVPGSRACCFSTCSGSSTTQGRTPTRDLPQTPVLPSHLSNEVGTLKRIFRSSIARPADASVYASNVASRRRPQDTRSRWFATPSL